jgi:hypothetical protein
MVGVVLAGGAAVAAVMAWKQWGATADGAPRTAGPGSGSARKAPVTGRDEVAAPPSQKQLVASASAAIDAGAPVAPSAGSNTGSAAGSNAAPPEHADAAATVTSTPPGAIVYVDGAEQGPTPITLPTAHDKHTVAVVMPGYALYTKETDSPEPIDVKLEEITPTGGEAGIKVKCKTPKRYYVFVDGKATGQLCPTERIHVTLGPHTVEVYDLVTEARTQYPVVLKDTEHSLRVKVD